MAGKIGVTITPTSFSLLSGDTVPVTVTLRNLGQTVDQFTVSIDGLDSSWYTLPVASVALFPNDQDSLKINFHPLKTGVKAGAYRFRVNVASRENPTEAVTVDLTLQVGALPEMGLEVSPPSITGRNGIYHVLVTNPGDAEIRLDLKVSDAQGNLRFSLQPASLKVPANGRAEVSLEVRLGWLAFFGGKKELDFQVQASVLGAEETRTVSGQLIRVPWWEPLTRLRLPWLARPPAISSFTLATEDRREFKLTWSVKRAAEVTLDGERVEPRGEQAVRPAEARNYVLAASNRYGSTSQTVTVQPLAMPKVKVSDKIRASLMPTELKVTAGAVPAIATLQLQNLSEIVDKFTVEVEGLEETWYSRSASSVALMPQASGQAQITFQPPKHKGVRAGNYPFAVTVRSQSMAGESASILGQLEVLPQVEFKVAVRPYRVTNRRKGKFRVNLANTNVSDATFVLEATDLDEGLRFQFKEDNPVVSAWNSVDVSMLTRPKRGSTVGERKRYDITVTARTEDGRAQSANAEFYHNPLMASWRPVRRALGTLLLIAFIVALIYFPLKWGGGWSTLTRSPQTWSNNLVNTVQSWFSR
jgi:uncharacterized membrane protein